MAEEDTVKSFKVDVPDSRLESLRSRLSEASFPDELDEAEWDLGAPLKDVKRLTAHWRDSYDWRKAEAQLNELPQFQTRIQASGFRPLSIHFVHAQSSVPNAIPLLFVHGWPGSFIEVEKLLPLLVNPAAKDQPAFHVVAPSLPNFGFSEGVQQRGFGLAQYAESFLKLMERLGYFQFVTQGGDWGMYITRTLGHLYPDRIMASHINMIRATAPTAETHPALTVQHVLQPYTARDEQGFARSKWFAEEGTGYRYQQSTKPQTLGYALVDSPVGLLAWILEKLHDWTDQYPWTDDEILTWISIYWHSTAGPAASLRIYYEATHAPSNPVKDAMPFVNRETAQKFIPTVPLGMAAFPKELNVVPRSWAHTLGPVVLYSEHEHGGHFAATEHPELIAEDLRKMLAKDGPVYGCVKGRDGYSVS